MKVPPEGEERGVERKRAWAAVALLFALAAFVADLVTPAGVLVSILYAVPVAITLCVGNLAFVWSVALLCAALDLALLAQGMQSQGWAVMLADRLMVALEILLIAVLIHLRLKSAQSVQEQRRALAGRNTELEAVNHELAQREEEIARQNEELQEQTEELERQSEELRVTNEELASRERMLEQFLELSRGLTAEMSRGEVLGKICEALDVFMNGKPVAVFEKRGEELVLLCHYGFGPGGPEAKRIPLARSFASAIMSMGQTGYLEDIQQRPDLEIPRLKDGQPFRAIIASPLKVGGRSVGTIEVYSATPHQWGEADIAAIESLAAQASISLESADLVEGIRQERRRFEAAFRTMPFGMVVAEDRELRHVRMNPAAAALLGLPVDENISPSAPAGLRLMRSVFRDTLPVPEDQLPLARAVRGEETVALDLEMVFPGGKRLNLLMSAAPIFDGSGAIVGAVAGFADVTAQKSYLRELEVRRREAEEASVRKTRFLAAVSHDIRTPANAINLMAEVIKRTASKPAMAAEIPDLAAKLQANVYSLIELVGDLLDITRFDTGKIAVEESEFSLGDFIAEECSQLLPLAREKGLTLSCEPGARPVWIRTDKVKLGRVLGNLIGNAIKFTEKGGVEVRLSSMPDPQHRVRLEVRDTGVGIPPEQLPLVFDEFAQLRNPARDRSKGTGLGLAISKRLVDILGGSLSVESEVGRGSTFVMSMPASSVVLRLEGLPPAEARDARSDHQHEHSLRGLRILLVEDHQISREGAASILQQEGATVVEASDGRSALRLLTEDNFRVVLLDMMLPDMDGREVLKAIQARRPVGLQAVLVLTADLTGERLEEVRRLGAEGLLGKPLEVRKLIGVLRGFTGHES